MTALLYFVKWTARPRAASIYFPLEHSYLLVKRQPRPTVIDIVQWLAFFHPVWNEPILT